MHPLSFIDDPTRILRAIRFEQRFKFRIDPKTFKYLKESVSLGMLEKVHPHRLRDELIIMLKEKAPANNIKRLAQLGGLKFIHPRLRITRSNTALFNSVKNKISWFKSGHFERRPVEYWLVYLMALLDALNLGEAKKICQEFGFRKGEAKRIFDYKEVNRSKVFELNKAKIKPSRIYAILEPLSYESIIMLAAKYSRVYLNEHIADFLEIYNGMRIYVSGEDLHGLGVLPGPGYQKIFSHVLNAKLNGQVRTKEQEMLLIKELIKKRSR
jgi:tRNA nucleotidyltransferase (CCA-adding enzyme)